MIDLKKLYRIAGDQVIVRMCFDRFGFEKNIKIELVSLQLIRGDTFLGRVKVTMNDLYYGSIEIENSLWEKCHIGLREVTESWLSCQYEWYSDRPFKLSFHSSVYKELPKPKIGKYHPQVISILTMLRYLLPIHNIQNKSDDISQEIVSDFQKTVSSRLGGMLRSIWETKEQEGLFLFHR